ncbi:transposase [Cucumis melo var. makuwa]|uniref:Transposase n=1 Tax=Cucumis melo var. makuwa TaxID=1194695 RepID=A0A5D3CC39_CUCMM|nr:transposase [Cucumis melo var. makuwa]
MPRMSLLVERMLVERLLAERLLVECLLVRRLLLNTYSSNARRTLAKRLSNGWRMIAQRLTNGCRCYRTSRHSPPRRTSLPSSPNASPLLPCSPNAERQLALPNSSFYGESLKFDTHTCKENDIGSVKEMIEVAHEEYSKDPNEFEKLLINAEKPLKEFSNATECPECGQSRWKNAKDRNEERKQIPSKLICEKIEDGKLRHPADSPAWKLVDFKWPDFGSEPRNLCLALSADGVNPHGPKQPGDDIGTYLAPLIEDLKLLWENGVECYDAYREEVFKLRTHKSQDHLDTSNIGRPLSMGVPFKPEQELLRQAHRYVLKNTIDIQPYMECRYHTKSSEKDRSVQNSGVQNSGGARIDELGYTLVDLNRVGHKSDSFILASQAKQVFYVEDPSDVRWSVVLTLPQRDFEDRYNDGELGDTILRCEGIPNDMPDVYLNNDLDENVSTYVRSDCKGTWIPT